MHKHPLVLALLLLCICAVPNTAPAAAQTAATSTLLYEYWPTQTGDGASLTATILNSNFIDTAMLFVPRQNMRVSSVCLAVETYGTAETGLALGVYEMSENLRGTMLLGASEPLTLPSEPVEWYTAGGQTCVSFTTPVSLTKDKQYALAFDHTKTTQAQDVFMYFGYHVGDPDLHVGVTTAIIGGTVITNDDKPYIRIYGNLEQHPVLVVPGILGSWENNGAWVLDPFGHTYSNLVDTLAANGYRPDWELFTLPYNWEQSNVTTAHELARKIAQIKEVCSCSRVDIVAHSMGGLVAAQYITSAEYGHDVGQLITLGTPFAGSPKAYKMWEAGEVDFESGYVNTVLNRIFLREAKDNGYDTIFAYLRGKPVPSVEELLPVHLSYLLNKDGTYRPYPSSYPQNQFLSALLREEAVATLTSRVGLHVVVGNTGTSTPAWYTTINSTKLPLWPDGEVVDTTLGQGDGTVPLENAQYLKEAALVLPAAHRTLPSAGSAYVYKQLTGKEAPVVVNKNYRMYESDFGVLLQKTAPSKADFTDFLQTVQEAFTDTLSSSIKRTALFITLYSPVDMQVTAPDGKRLGKDFATGNSLAEIPNAAYSGPVAEHEYVVIEDPLPGTYKVETIGTGNGTYTIASGLVSDTTATSSLLAGTTTLGQIITNTLFVSGTTTSLNLTPPQPIATSSPTTTEPVLNSCAVEIAKAYQAKWIGKKRIYEKIVADCKILSELFKKRETIEKIPATTRTSLQKALLAGTYTAIRLTVADMELLAKDSGNTKDAVLLITKITTWVKKQI